MGASDTSTVVTIVVIAFVYTALMYLSFRFATARTPAGVVRRLLHSHRPLVLKLDTLSLHAWDPSRPVGQGGLLGRGVATYTLIEPSTVRVRFEPQSGKVIERQGPIPASLQPESPETRHRRRVADAVFALYVVIGAGAFALTAWLVSGSDSFRARVAGVVALGVLVVVWLVTHIVLTRPRRPADASPSTGAASFAEHLRRYLIWVTGLVVVAVALAIAWRVDSLDQPNPTSWTSAFVDAGIFVVVCAAVLAASSHHHNYVHNNDHHADPPTVP